MRTSYVLAFLIPLLLSMSIYLLVMPEFREIEMKVRVGNYTGVDVNTTALAFGTLYGGGTSNRTLIITNADNYDKVALIGAGGEMAGFVYFINETRVPAGMNATVNIWAQPPADAEPRLYTGMLKVFLRRAI